MVPDADPFERSVAVDEAPPDADEREHVVLSDLINRVLDKGVVISGHVTISIAEIDLIALDLRLLITSIQTAIARPRGADTHDDA